MDLKQKIALAELKKKVDRGIISEEKGMELFEQITGRNANDVPVEGDKLAEHVDALAKTTKNKGKAKQETKPEDFTEKKSETDPASQFQVSTAQQAVKLFQQFTVQQNPDRIDTERTKEQPDE